MLLFLTILLVAGSLVGTNQTLGDADLTDAQDDDKINQEDY